MNGIQFESTLSWKEVLAKAKSQNKYIFIDCYTTWCGPCKWMEKNIYPQKEVGDFINSHFISVAVQMDKTPKDSETARNWYSEAEKIAKEYKVNAYPTYLFFSADGHILHRFIGVTKEVKDFIAKTSEALDSTRQYYTIMKEWEKYKGDTAFLHHALIEALHQEDGERARLIGESFLESQSNPLTKENLKLITRLGLIHSSKDKWFNLLKENAASIDEYMGRINGKNIFVEWALQSTIIAEEMAPLYSQGESIKWSSVSASLMDKYPSLGKKLVDLVEEDFAYHIGKHIKATLAVLGSSTPDWDQIADELKKKYPDFDFGQMLLQGKVSFYKDKRQWPAYADASYALMQRYGDHIDDYDMNNIVWEVFLHSADKKILVEALKWMKRAIVNHSQEDWLDTYANLLYKLGNKDEAIIWEKRAIESAVKSHALPKDVKICQENLERMQKDEPTWEENI